MTANDLTRQLMDSYDTFRVDRLTPARCTLGTITPLISEFLTRDGSALRRFELGSSVEGRSISCLTFGSGTTGVLLWSQMHGDEPTATLALLDIYNLVSGTGSSESWVHEILAGTTVWSIPMLNPDGAERRRRHTAVEIDMNRDARMLATPEARILRDAQRRFSPAFGFNLHDQDLSSVGETPRVAVLALLAPPADEARTVTPGRKRAMKVGAVIAGALEPYVGGHLATYDDTFEPRAFGDSMQLWGTSTLLIESGQWPDDPDKSFVRKLNAVALLTALYAIATGTVDNADLNAYTSLPRNGGRVLDLVVRGVKLAHPGGWSHTVDVGLVRGTPLNGGTQFTVKHVGDLSTFGALRVLRGNGAGIEPSLLRIDTVLTDADVERLFPQPHR